MPIKNPSNSSTDRRVLINGLTLIALGVSIFVLDTWGNLFVRLFVGLFWTSFLLFLNGPGVLRALRILKTNGRHSSEHNLAQRTLGH
jgi:hypothetical protein